MTPAETAFFRWFEVFTISPETVEPCDHFDTAFSRGYATKRRGGGGEVTADGWEWYTVRAARIIARCNAGHHDYAKKTPFCESVHCRWCGHCADWPCEECQKFFLSGTIEGGWDVPILPSYDVAPRSTITHGYEHG